MELQPVSYSPKALSASAPASESDDCKGWAALNSAGTIALAFIPYVGPALSALAYAYKDNLVSGLCGKGWGSVSQEQAVATYKTGEGLYDFYTSKQDAQAVDLETAVA